MLEMGRAFADAISRRAVIVQGKAFEVKASDSNVRAGDGDGEG